MLSASHRSAALVLVLVAIFLGGCILFPPFGMNDPSVVIVKNETDREWVVELGTEFPETFAVPSGATGEITLFGGTARSVRLLTADCDPVAEETLEPGTVAIRIAGEGRIIPLDERPDATDGFFAEYHECGGGFGAEPDVVDAAPDASGRIHLSGGGDLWTLEPNTGRLERLTDSDAYDEEAAWSPDGTRVAFVRYDDAGSADLHVMAADGTGQRLLVENAATPSWSPDGSMIAFIDLDPFSGGSSLSVVAADGGQPLALARNASGPAWSPDGSTVAFAHASASLSSGDMPESSEIRVIGPDGEGMRTLATDAVPFATAPVWSPDGRSLLYLRAAEGMFGSAGLAIVDLDGSGRMLVESSSTWIDGAVWSPDGSRIAVAASSIGLVGESSSIGFVPAAGGPLATLASGDEIWYSGLTWSPDGRHLAATRAASSTFATELVIIDVADGTVTVVARGDIQLVEWRPD